MVRQRFTAGIFIVIITIFTLVGVGFVLATETSNSSPLVQSAQIAGAGFSVVLSTLLVLLYAQQKELLERQTDLQASSIEADIHFSDQEFTKQDRLHFTVSNRGGGKATNFTLVMEMIPSIGSNSTFKFDLVRFRGKYENEPIVTPNETKADLYLVTEDDPSVSTDPYNTIYWSLMKKMYPDRDIKIEFKILYDDIVSDGNRVSGFRQSERIEICESYSENPDKFIKSAIRERFEDNLGDLLTNNRIISQMRLSINRML